MESFIVGVVAPVYAKWKYGLLSRKKRVLLRKYQEIQPTFLSNIGLYHAMYSLYMFMKCTWWMTYGQGHLISILGPGQSSALRPLSMQTLTGLNCKWSIKLNIYSGTCVIRHLSFPTFCDFRQEFQVPKYFFNILC